MKPIERANFVTFRHVNNVAILIFEIICKLEIRFIQQKNKNKKAVLYVTRRCLIKVKQQSEENLLV